MVKTFRRWIAVACMAGAVPAFGQYYVQQGNILDANTRVGSGGLNYGGRDYRSGINSGNRLITGNSAGGTAFRGLSPIRDPNSFYLGTPSVNGGLLSNRGGLSSGLLPSDALSSFQRDSANISDPRRFQGMPTMLSRPYYAPGSTVTNTGQILRGMNEPGTSQVRNPYESLRMDYRPQPQNPLDATRGNALMGTSLNVDTRLVRANTGLSTTGKVNERLLRSPLFGSVQQVPLSQVAAQTAPLGTAINPGTALAGGTAQPSTSRGVRSDQAGSPLDRLLGQQQSGTQLTATPEQSTLRQTKSEGQRTEAGERGGTLAAKAGSPESPIPGRPKSAAGVPTDVLLLTFQGTPDQRLNEQLALAEELLQQQRYYDAARRYEVAHTINLEHPLPLFGRSMALLAAGDYVSSANDLFMAIQSAGPAGAIKVDLKRFVPDVKVFDRRRAFIEQQLETADDFRLRFLLGWAEYMTGQTDRGLTNMSQASKLAPAQMSVLQDYVGRLSAETAGKSTTPATRPG